MVQDIASSSLTNMDRAPRRMYQTSEPGARTTRAERAARSSKRTLVREAVMLGAHKGQRGRGLEARGSLWSLQRNQDGVEKEGAARGLRVSPAGAEAPIRAQLQGIRQLGGQWAWGGCHHHTGTGLPGRQL